jgi:hypothetical protein
LLLNRWIAVERNVNAPKSVVLSEWQQGERVARREVSPEQAKAERSQFSHLARRLVAEEILDEGPVIGRSRLLFGASFVTNHDGVKVIYRDRIVYLTPDDLLRWHAYDAEIELLGIPLTLGVKRDIVLSAAAAELRTSSAQLLAEGRFRRLAMRHAIGSKQSPQPDVATLRGAVLAAGNYLARQVNTDGRFRYEVDAIDGEVAPGYSWPRHAGSTWFLARAANREQDGYMWQKALLATSRLTNFASLRCGSNRCIGEGQRVDLGSSALTLLAVCEMYTASLNPDWEPVIRELAAFIRSQQRPDGEFAHTYDRQTSMPIDEQFPFYSGEATLALSRSHLITHDPRDLEAAARALDYLVSRPPIFLTWRYFWRSEHWTCQAVTDLWTRKPSPAGLDFCLAWQRYNRAATSRDPEYRGAAGRYLFRSVPLTGTASTTEAAVATLALSRMASMEAKEVGELERGIRNSLTLLLRNQLTPGPEYLMKNPAAMRGGMPASTTDLRVRIDYVQHAGAAWLGYLAWLENEPWSL